MADFDGVTPVCNMEDRVGIISLLDKKYISTGKQFDAIIHFGRNV